MVNPIVVVENFNSGLTGLDFRKASSSKHQLTVATTGSGNRSLETSTLLRNTMQV